MIFIFFKLTPLAFLIYPLLFIIILEKKKTKSKPIEISPSKESSLTPAGFIPTPVELQKEIEPSVIEVDETSRPDLASGYVSETVAQQPASPTTIRAAKEVEIPSSQQELMLKEVSSSATTTGAAEIPTLEGVQGDKIEIISNIEIPIQSVAKPIAKTSTSKDDVNLTKETPQSAFSAKIIEQSEVITEKTTLDQPKSGDAQIEQIQLEQAHPIEVLHFIPT